MRVDDAFTLYADGVQIGTGTGWNARFTFSIPDDTTVMAVFIHNMVSAKSQCSIVVAMQCRPRYTAC